MANKLTDELLKQLFYIGEDGKLYRKPIEENIDFCSPRKWNALAAKNQPIEIDFISLKPVGLSSYKTDLIRDALRTNLRQARSIRKQNALRATEKNLDKAILAKKEKCAVETVQSSAVKPSNGLSQYEKRKAKKEQICRKSVTNESCGNCQHIRMRNRSSYYCKKHVIFVTLSDVCDDFIEPPRPALKPTISEVLAQARKTSNFRDAYLSALKTGAYRV